MSWAVSATAARSSAKRDSVAEGIWTVMRRAGARRMVSMPSMASGSPCGVEPGQATGTGWTSP
eukprot:15446519-Alexandrium_andersonii.AAC.1